MKTLQQEFFDTLNARCEARRCRVVDERSYSNAGRVTIMPERGFEPLVSFMYQFQTGHNVFESAASMFSVEPPAGSNPNMDIVKRAGDIGRVLDAIDRELTRLIVVDHARVPRERLDSLHPAVTAADYAVAAVGVDNALVLLAALRAEWLTPDEANALEELARGVAQILGVELPEHRRQPVVVDGLGQRVEIGSR